MKEPTSAKPYLVEILSAADPMKIQIAHDLLTQGGIESFIFNEDSYYVEHNVLIQLMVPAAKRDEAVALLTELGLFGKSD